MEIETGEVRISIPFTVTDGTTTFSDALVLTQDQFNNINDVEIEILQANRFNNFIASVAEVSTKEAPEPTDEELKQQYAEIQTSKEALVAMEAEIVSKAERRNIDVTKLEIAAEEPAEAVKADVKAR